jgi:hypothetical protein
MNDKENLVTLDPNQPISQQPVTVTRKASSGARLLNVVLAVAVAVAIGGVAFAAGRSTAPVSAATGGRGGLGGGAGFPGGSFAPGASGQPGLGRGGFGGGGLSISGTVESVDATTMTVKTAAGQTIQVTTGTSTTYHTQSAASASDVQAGTSVQIQLEGGAGRPSASAPPSGPVGTASSVTVVP